MAIVADDLTGAMDAAGPFAAAAHGARVCCGAAAPSVSPSTPPPDVLAVTSASRHLPPHDAAAATRRAVERATRGQPPILFKKIDSTLRGNVAVEIAAALSASGRRHAVIAPAVPLQGRSLVGGELCLKSASAQVGPNAPANERAAVRPADAIARDAPHLHVRLFGGPAGFTLSEPVRDARAGSVAHIIDCETDADLAAIASAGLTAARDVLLVGAAGLAKAVARQVVGDARAFVLERRQPGPMLFVVGSLANASRVQAERLLASKPDVVELAIPATPGSLPLIPGDPEAILLRSDSRIRDIDTTDVAGQLAACTTSLMLDRWPRAIVVTGGDTAQAVVDRLGIAFLEVVGEPAHGVVASECSVGGRTALIVTKAGGFGAESLFVDLLARL